MHGDTLIFFQLLLPFYNPKKSWSRDDPLRVKGPTVQTHIVIVALDLWKGNIHMCSNWLKCLSLYTLMEFWSEMIYLVEAMGLYITGG